MGVNSVSSKTKQNFFARLINHIHSYTIRLIRDIRMHKGAYLLVLPVVAFYILFCYKPMYGLLIAFKHYSPAKGIMGSSWAGFQYFEEFLKNPYFWRLMRNTLNISISNLLRRHICRIFCRNPGGIKSGCG